LDILRSNAEQRTIRYALKMLQAGVQVNYTTVSGCNFTTGK
jgi:hypothetical protein